MISKIIAGLIIILLSPIFLIISLVLIIDDGFPIIFKQKRVGGNNSIFKIYKFRTMKVETPKNIATHLLNDPKRFNTHLGTYFRKLSIDELPQLYNILKGDMNFIGPRPPLPNQKDLIYLRRQNNLEYLKPGITGWAQINGRDEISIEKKVKLERYYSENKSFLLDVKIIFLTFVKVIITKGVSH